MLKKRRYLSMSILVSFCNPLIPYFSRSFYQFQIFVVTSHIAMTDDEGPWHPYRYTPSTLLAAIFLGLFGLTTLLHAFQLVRTRTWYLIPLLTGGVFEVIGFIGRLLSEKNDISVLGPYIVQAIFILIAPALFAASIYTVLGRIILMVDGERYSWVRQRHLTAAFVMGDVLSFQFQSNGM
jgi:hypothetical protein